MKERICCVCRKKDLATDRIRIGRIDGKFFVDKAGNGNGRGAYVCVACVEQCAKKRQLNRAFKAPVPNELYEELINYSKNIATADKR